MRRPPFSFLSIAFVVVLICNYFILNAQDCHCPEWEKKSSSGNTLSPSQLALLANPACKGKAFELMASSFLVGKELDSAAIYLERSAGEYKRTGCRDEIYLIIYKLWSNLYVNRADYPSSLDYSYKVLAISEKTNNHIEKANGLLNISQIFNRMGQADKGIAYCRQAIPITTDLSPSAEKADLLNKISARYYFYSQDFKDSLYTDTSAIYVQQALATARLVNDRKTQIIAWMRMNAIAYNRKNFPLALSYIDSSLSLCIPGMDNPQFATNYGDKGNILLRMGQLPEARRFADSCLYYNQLEKFPPLIANAYSLIYEIAIQSGNHKDALWALEGEKKISDSLNRADRIKAVNELEKKYNQDRNERTIRELAQQKRIYLLLVIGALLAIATIIFYLRQQSLKHKQKILETQQRLNRARINPHFFFNALGSLQDLAMKEKDGKIMAANLSRFSYIMRETLESTYKEYVTIEYEIDFIREYLELQQIRFPEKFSYEIITSPELELHEQIMPAMILQPFIENSIEHGFSGIDYHGHISLHFEKKDEELHITLIDNGKGMLPSAMDGKTFPEKSTNEHISRASQIIHDRIYLLNMKLKAKAGFSIEPGTGQKGVTVSIHLPILHKE